MLPNLVKSQKTLPINNLEWQVVHKRPCLIDVSHIYPVHLTLQLRHYTHPFKKLSFQSKPAFWIKSVSSFLDSSVSLYLSQITTLQNIAYYLITMEQLTIAWKWCKTSAWKDRQLIWERWHHMKWMRQFKVMNISASHACHLLVSPQDAVGYGICTYFKWSVPHRISKL